MRSEPTSRPGTAAVPIGEIDLFGLRSPTVVRAMIALGVVYVLATAGSGLRIESAWSWIGLSAAFVLLAADVAVMTRAVGDPLGRPVAIAGVAMMIAGTSCAWWSVPSATFEPLQCLPAAVVGIVVLALLAIRGRLGVAWVGAVGLSVCAAAWGELRGLGFMSGLVFTSWVYPVMVFATLFVVMLRPMADSIRTLHAREIGFAADAAATRAAAEERNRQLLLLDRRARPLLEQVAAVHDFDPDEVAGARLVEAELRDGIRAPAWQSARVRAAVWQARRRGVWVVLLDDGGMVGAEAIQSRLDDVLVGELERVRSGRITARVMPPGRTTRATIVVDDAGVARRYDCAEDGEISGGLGGRQC